MSGVVRKAFKDLGHDAWSCDIVDCEDGSKYHIKDDVLNHLNDGWDLMIAFPPCTHLAVSGARWFKYKVEEQKQALEFVRTLMNASINRICIENPVGIISTRICKPQQIIQPWMFGHMETKATCLWLKNLPKLKSTDNVYDEMMKLPIKVRQRIHNLPPSKDRGKIRSYTYTGIAKALADQYGETI
jgi:site-specific DNA-cytosine methylase